jgi:hypothetical protein
MLIDSITTIVPIPLCMFIKHNVSSHMYLAKDWIIVSIDFRLELISNEEHWSAAVVEFLQIWSHVLNMHHAPKSAKMLNARLLPDPSYKWCLPFHALSWRAIQQVNYCSYRFSPQPTRQTLYLEQIVCHSHHGLVVAFNHTVLLWRVSHCLLASYTVLDAVLDEFDGGELTAMIYPECSQLMSLLHLDHALELLDGCRGLVLGVQFS